MPPDETASPDAPADAPDAVPAPPPDEASAGAEPAEGTAPPPEPPKPSKLRETLAQRRGEKRQRVEQLQRERAELARQAEALQAELREAKVARETLALAKQDPLKFLEAAGLQYEELVKHSLQQGTPDAKLAALERRLAERDEADKKARAEAEKAAEQAAHAAVTKRFLEVARADDGGKYPELSVYDDDEIAQVGEALANRLYEETGKVHSLEEIAAALEKLVAEKHDKIEQARQKRKAAKSPPAAPAGPSTLSNRDAAERTGKGGPPKGTLVAEDDLVRSLAAALPF